jgi:hypothetical protein
VHREYIELGRHAGIAGVAGASLGFQSGAEATDVRSTTDTAGVTTDEWWTRNFSGELTLSLHAGDRGGAWSEFCDNVPIPLIFRLAPVANPLG